MLILAFFLAFFALLLFSAIFPALHLCFYAPFLLLLMPKISWIRFLWIACFCGLMIDLFSSSFFGIHALNLSLTAWIFLFCKQFLHEKPMNLFIFTYLFSSLSSLLFVMILPLFGHSLPLSGFWFFSDLMLFPLLDGLYAILWFFIPLNFYKKIHDLIKRRMLESQNEET
jgi:rod shape-determining protein MreD